MLLTIQNLPLSVTYKDIKALVFSKCGIDDIILDNLVVHDNRTKKVTVGLSEEEDGAVLLRRLNGAMMNGHQLTVLSKAKNYNNTNQGMHQPSQSAPMKSSGTQGTGWSQLDLRHPPPPPPRANEPAMVPPSKRPHGYGDSNTCQPQQAYYMMNQPDYLAYPLGPNLGYQTYNNLGFNQSHNQNSWPDNDWNQPQPGGSQNNSSKNKREANSRATWDNDGAMWGNNDSNWDDNRAPKPKSVRQSRWENNDRSKGDGYRDQRSNEDNDSRWRNNRDSNHEYSNQSAGPSRDRNEPGPSRDRNQPGVSRDRNQPGVSRDRNQLGVSRERNDPYGRGDQHNLQQASYNVYGSRPVSSFKSRDKVPERSRYKIVNDPQQNRQGSGDVRQQNRFKPERQPTNRPTAGRDRSRSPLQKRQKNDAPRVPYSKRYHTPNEREARRAQIGRLWRGQFIARKAREILAHPRFEYETDNYNKLVKKLQYHINKNISAFSTRGDYITMPKLESLYSKHVGYKKTWEFLRDSLQRVGGQLFSKLEDGPDNSLPRLPKKIKEPKPMELMLPRQGEGQANAPKRKRTRTKKSPNTSMHPQVDVSGNLKQEQTYNEPNGSVAGPSEADNGDVIEVHSLDEPNEPVAAVAGPSNVGNQTVQQNEIREPPAPFHPKVGNQNVQGNEFRAPAARPGPSKSKAKKSKGNKKGSTPLALIPGRIPQYPQGDKQIFKQNKREEKLMMSSDLSAPVFDCLKPEIRKAIEEEVRALCQAIEVPCDCPDEEKVVKLYEELKNVVPPEVEKAFQVNLARRIIPVLPVRVRVFSTPPLKRMALEQLLKQYDVIALKKSVHHTYYYIADCASVEVHDRLCTMKPLFVDDCTVTFKPFHLVDTKIDKGVLSKQRQDICIKELMAYEHNAAPTNTNTEIKTEPNKTIEEIPQVKVTPEFKPYNEMYYESYVQPKFGDDNLDFTDDIDIDNMSSDKDVNVKPIVNVQPIVNLKPMVDVKAIVAVKANVNVKTNVDDIDLADVDDDDLVDW